MRIWIDLLENLASPLSRFPKPHMLVSYDDEVEDPARIFKNPNAGLLRKIIGDFDCRALIDNESGDLYAWPELDCYHDDVRKALNIGRITRLMLNNPEKLDSHPCVSVKGFDPEPEPFTDQTVLAVLHNNRGLRALFGENFEVDTYDWY